MSYQTAAASIQPAPGEILNTSKETTTTEQEQQQQEELSGTAREKYRFALRKKKPVFYTLLLFLLFCVIALIIYSPALNAPFFLDDEINILRVSSIHLTEFSFGNLFRAAIDSHLGTRPVANMSFALNYYWGEKNTVGYHVVNDLIHALNGVLLYLLVHATLSLPAMLKRYGPSGLLPLGIALLWLVNPVHVQSVTYIVQRMNSLATLFYILTLLLYVNGRLSRDRVKKWSLFALGAITGLLGLGSKEITATLPFFIFLYEWLFLQNQDMKWLRYHLKFVGIVVAVFIIIAFIFLGANPLEGIFAGYKNNPDVVFTPLERVMTEFRVVIFYLSQLLFPHPSRLNLYHTVFISNSLISPLTTILSFFFIVGAIGLAIYLRKRNPLIFFSIIWYFGNLVIESTVIPLQIIFEHRSYLPSMFVFVLLGVLWCRYIKKRVAHIAILCFLISVCGFWTFERNKVWSNEITFWKDVTQKSPLESQPYNNLGNIFARQGKFVDAALYYAKSLRVDPRNWMTHHNYGLTLEQLGKLDEAIFQYNAALQINPDYPVTHYHLGKLLAQKQNFQQAVLHLSVANRLAPGKYPDIPGKIKIYQQWGGRQ
jgi:tetratricopeptide (TPR) repeat protein